MNKLSQALAGIAAAPTEIQKAARSGSVQAVNLLQAYQDYQKTKSDTHAEILISAHEKWMEYLKSFVRGNE